MSQFHGPNSQWDINPMVDHDRGLRRGVPHGAKRGGELRPIVMPSTIRLAPSPLLISSPRPCCGGRVSAVSLRLTAKSR
jgi:hypothetical protein